MTQHSPSDASSPTHDAARSAAQPFEDSTSAVEPQEQHRNGDRPTARIPDRRREPHSERDLGGSNRNTTSGSKPALRRPDGQKTNLNRVSSPEPSHPGRRFASTRSVPMPRVLPMQGSIQCSPSHEALLTQPSIPHQRLLNPDGRIDIVRLGHSHSPWRDRYHTLLIMPWWLFFLWTALVYLLANTVFAIGYLMGGDAIANAEPNSFADAFFFSVQTMASIGYGAMYPQTFYANVLVTIESLVGLMGIAMVTGLTFARFSRPTTRVMFSNVAVITVYDGVPTLMFRAANQRRNRIIEAQLTMTLVWNEISAEGHAMRRFYDLQLVRSQTPVFALSWTVMHPITSNHELYEDSPLYGKSHEELEELDVELVITLTGLDETLSQTVHARHSYAPADILRNKAFVDLFTHLSDGRFAIDYERFHQVRQVAPMHQLPEP